jgi:hypothetical protein
MVSVERNIAFLQELLKRLQDRHNECSQTVDRSEKATVDAPNVMQTMTLFQKVKDHTKVV